MDLNKDTLNPFAEDYVFESPAQTSPAREMAATSRDDWSIFPPHLHEGLLLLSEPFETLPSPRTSQQMMDAVVPQYFSNSEKGEEEPGTVSNSKPLFISAQRMVVSSIKLIRSKISGRSGGSVEIVGVGVCVFAALAGFFLYLRRRERLEKEFLLLLFQENNRKIELLVHQIAELNAILAAHRKVPLPLNT